MIWQKKLSFLSLFCLFLFFNFFFSISAFAYNYGYTGSVQTYTAQWGYYKLEVWGAQGGTRYTSGSGGKGGYSSGNIWLSPGTILYIYVGGTNGYNGGGAATGEPSGCGGSGGGGTDIRIGGTSLSDRVIVAGGNSGISRN